MKRIITLALALLIGFGLYWIFFTGKVKEGKDGKAETLTVKTHTEEFNKRVGEALDAYMKLKDAFVDADTAAIREQAGNFLVLLDSIPIEELKKDTTSIYEGVVSILSDIKSNIQSLQSQKDIAEMRKDFSMATEMMYPGFFKMIRYEGETLYLQHCPMAFGDDSGANWLSKTAEIINPYLGKNHPEFRSSMLHCGEIKDSIVSK